MTSSKAHKPAWRRLLSLPHSSRVHLQRFFRNFLTCCLFKSWQKKRVPAPTAITRKPAICSNLGWPGHPRNTPLDRRSVANWKSSNRAVYKISYRRFFIGSFSGKQPRVRITIPKQYCVLLTLPPIELASSVKDIRGRAAVKGFYFLQDDTLSYCGLVGSFFVPFCFPPRRKRTQVKLCAIRLTYFARCWFNITFVRIGVKKAEIYIDQEETVYPIWYQSSCAKRDRTHSIISSQEVRSKYRCIAKE